MNHKTALEIAELRLANQRLIGSSFEAPQDVVAWLGALQAQEYAPAKWSVGQRAVGLNDAALERAMADGSILRTHALRPTWHFVTPADIRWLQALTAPRVRAFLAYYDRRLEIDEALRGRSRDAIAGALEGGKKFTRKELQAALADAGIEASGQRLGHLVMHAELDALICSGGLRGKQHTYALVDERAPKLSMPIREEALRELALRYFRSHGPATLKDYQWWCSLSMADVRRSIELAGQGLEHRRFDGRSYYVTELPPISRRDAPFAHLLQCYDEYVIAYSESRGVLDSAGLMGAATGGGVWDPYFVHVLLVDGQITGFWRREATPKAITVELRLLRPLDGHEASALQSEVARYERFAGVPVNLKSGRA